MTRMNLDQMICGNAGCKKKHEALVFHSNCHRGAPTWVRYDKDALPGVIEIVCAECESLITRIRVAAEG